MIDCENMNMEEDKYRTALQFVSGRINPSSYQGKLPFGQMFVEMDVMVCVVNYSASFA